ncbi:MAG: SDR family NAD(P)-dependent oxidoreductase, partial [Planctomycetota bacterium]
MEIAGKVALITGAARRLGKAMACRLAAEGMHVAVHWHSSRDEAQQTVEECRSHGVNALSVQGDLADPGCSSRIIEEARELGTLQVLVNNASRFIPLDLENLDSEELEKDHRIHVVSPTLLCRQFARQLPAEESGRVIQMLDWRSKVADPKYFTYGLAKAGLLHLTRLLAQELAPQITVNAISPGSILPPPTSDPNCAKQALADPLLNKSGTVKQIEEALVFLIREADHTTGHVFPIDG